MSRKRCRIRDHHDRRLRGGRRYQCTICGDIFPCRSCCSHYDCIVATGRELPDDIDDHASAREAIAAELALIYPDHAFACRLLQFHDPKDAHKYDMDGTGP